MATKRLPKKASGDCVIPTRPKPEFLRASLAESSPKEEAEIASYFEWQSSKDPQGPATVEHLELIKSEYVFGQEYKVWDVHATGGRWWVVTNPTNLYSQEHIPSLDFVLSFHVGLMARVQSRDWRRAKGPNVERFAAAWRRWEQAASAVDRAAEAEDFQAIGMKCRECLLAFVRDTQIDVSLREGAQKPKRSDFVEWADLIADWAVPGSHSKDIRAYLKQLAGSTWPLVNWLTHTSSAARNDAELIVSATSHILDSFAAALVRRESQLPDRCPKCSSYQVQSFYTPELEQDPPYLLVCHACGWEAPQQAQNSPIEASPRGAVS
jgi:hypothetical protein